MIRRKNVCCNDYGIREKEGFVNKHPEHAGNSMWIDTAQFMQRSEAAQKISIAKKTEADQESSSQWSIDTSEFNSEEGANIK